MKQNMANLIHAKEIEQTKFFTYVDHIIHRMETNKVFADKILEEDESLYKHSLPII
jgi:hypothetical protein